MLRRRFLLIPASLLIANVCFSKAAVLSENERIIDNDMETVHLHSRIRPRISLVTGSFFPIGHLFTNLKILSKSDVGDNEIKENLRYDGVHPKDTGKAARHLRGVSISGKDARRIQTANAEFGNIQDAGRPKSEMVLVDISHSESRERINIKEPKASKNGKDPAGSKRGVDREVITGDAKARSAEHKSSDAKSKDKPVEKGAKRLSDSTYGSRREKTNKDSVSNKRPNALQAMRRKKGTSAAKRRNSTALQKIKQYGLKLSSVPPKQKFVKIGNASIPRGKVAVVGDVDGNGVKDMIVSNVAAGNYSGTVRLYLMGKKNKFLYTRDLVPGNWGFQHEDLSPGDRYGATLFRLPANRDSPECFIAITAPGDRSMKEAQGAVYILELSSKGNVENHTKLSAESFLLLLEEEKKESRKKEEKKLSGKLSGVPWSANLTYLKGVTSMVFLNNTGQMQASFDMTTKDKDLLLLIEKHLRGSRKKATANRKSLERVLLRALVHSTCVNSRTHCSCVTRVAGTEDHKCFDAFESRDRPRKFICVPKECPMSFECSCNGSEVCRKVDELREIYTLLRPGPRNETYCTAQKTRLQTIIPVSA